jgi:hypothetical protein
MLIILRKQLTNIERKTKFTLVTLIVLKIDILSVILSCVVELCPVPTLLVPKHV